MEAQQAAVLLNGYRFELGDHDSRQWVSLWLESYRASWIRDAVVEALYQGRYKSVSVKQILDMWQRRGQPIRHATHEFEAAVCREFGEVRLAPVPPEQLAQSAQPNRLSGKQPRSIARPRATQPASPNGRSDSQYEGYGSEPYQDSNRTRLQPNAVSGNALSGNALSGNALSNRQHLRPNAAVSFNLAALPPASPGMAARGEAVIKQNQAGQHPSNQPNPSENRTESAEQKPTVELRDNRDWREFPGYTTPTYSASSPDEVLRAQRQFNGVLYSSARAIQPFKPALPFSAQTLRRAKQKAIALMDEAQKNLPADAYTHAPMAEQMADSRR